MALTQLRYRLPQLGHWSARAQRPTIGLTLTSLGCAVDKTISQRLSGHHHGGSADHRLQRDRARKVAARAKTRHDREAGLKLPKSALGLDVWGRDIPALAHANGDIDGYCHLVEGSLRPLLLSAVWTRLRFAQHV